MKLQFLEAGEIVTTHGIRGEVKVNPWTDGPEFLKDFKRVRIDGRKYKVESCRVQKTCSLLKLQGVDRVEDAEALRGKTVEIYREDVKPGVVFVAELIGMRVTADGEEIGKISDVLDYPGNKVYVVSGEQEYMIPAVPQFILNIDLDTDTVQVRLLEGMECDED